MGIFITVYYISLSNFHKVSRFDFEFCAKNTLSLLDVLKEVVETASRNALNNVFLHSYLDLFLPSYLNT